MQNGFKSDRLGWAPDGFKLPSVDANSRCQTVGCGGVASVYAELKQVEVHTR